MGKVIIQSETTKKPITLIGKEAGCCYGSDVSDDTKNYKRGKELLSTGHGRTWEFPQVYLTLEGYSARVIRELYTHIGGAPTRLQASTRYINYGDFMYIIPPSVQRDPQANQIYTKTMSLIKENFAKLQELNVPKEDIANILPLGMTTTIVLRTNLRNLIDMAHQRLCTRAYWEFRNLMKDIKKALAEYDPEWEEITNEFFVPKCDVMYYCPERKGCLRHVSKELFKIFIPKIS